MYTYTQDATLRLHIFWKLNALSGRSGPLFSAGGSGGKLELDSFPMLCFKVNTHLGLHSTECSVNSELFERFGLSLFVDLPLRCF